MSEKEEGICKDCCWFDGDHTCLKDPIFNEAGDGSVRGMLECSGYVQIEESNDE